MAQQVDAFGQNRRLGRGVNVIGYDRALWQSRDMGRMRERHFRLIAEAGFDHVRINLHPFAFMGSAPDYAIQAGWLDTLDWAVAQALDVGLAVILDMHEFIAIGRDPVGLKPRLMATWDQLGARYRGYPPTVLFELLNEPNGALTPALWNDYLVAPYELVRRTNPERTLIIGPAWWNGIDYLDELELPESDRNIIATVHYYHPMPFTHQGAPWTEHRDLSGVEWLGTPEERSLIARELGGVQRWAEQHDRPILLGEFGAYEAADMASRARWTGYVARECERMGWSWSYWQFDSDFVLYDIDRDGWVTPIRDALIPPQA
ncbi:MAG: glycoside hydrolase family 5 protein [Anaerolineae bacterium]|nr:glycoside hydrolase family 5 protein [Anaerolineae bacterium]